MSFCGKNVVMGGNLICLMEKCLIKQLTFALRGVMLNVGHMKFADTFGYDDLKDEQRIAKASEAI